MLIPRLKFILATAYFDRIEERKAETEFDSLTGRWLI